MGGKQSAINVPIIYNPDDSITYKYRGVTDVTFCKHDSTESSPISTVVHIVSWVLLILKLLYCIFVALVLIMDKAYRDRDWNVRLGILPTRNEHNFAETIEYVYYVNYARWILFTVGPRIRHFRMQRYVDLLEKIPDLRDSIKNVVLFILSDLINFNMLNSILIIAGMRSWSSHRYALILPALFVSVQYLSPPHMIKAIFDRHVREFVVKPSLWSYDCNFYPSELSEYLKVLMIDFCLNWRNFYLWACYWCFLIIGLILLYPLIALCGYITRCISQKSSWLQKGVRYFIVFPLLFFVSLFFAFGEIVSFTSFGLLFTLAILLIERQIIDEYSLLHYFPNYLNRLQQPSNNVSVDKVVSPIYIPPSF